LYRALQKQGKTVEEAGKILYDCADVYFSSLSWLSRFGLRLFWWLTFTGLGKKITMNNAIESQKRRYPDDFVFSYVAGDGKEFDYGTDFTECAVCKFFHKQGADEITPYICLSDFPMSRAAGGGLRRTTTLAGGAERCDFRYKRGREAQRGWPPAFLKKS
jgi:hypothetical protein